MNTHILNDFLNQIKNDFNPPLDHRVDINKYTEKLINNAIIDTIYLNGKLIGICAYYNNDPDFKYAYLSMIAVLNEHKGKHIAQNLLLSSIANLTESNFEKYILDVDKNNKSAYGLYIKLGFRLLSEKEEKYTLVMDLIENKKNNVENKFIS